MASRKRGQGEGSIRQKADGRWEARYVGAAGGRKSIMGRTRAEVAKQLAEAIRDRDKGLPTMVGDRQTVGDYLTAWLETMRPPRIRASTWLRYESHVRVHIIPHIGHIRLTQLNRMHIQQLHAKASAAGLAPSTIGPMHAILHHALKDAMRSDLVWRNVAELVTPPRIERREMSIYTPDQVDTLLATAEGQHPAILAPLVALTVTTGMRAGELLALRWSNVDMACGVLHVKRTRTRDFGKWTDGKTTKTPAGVRDIKLIPDVVDALRAHRARQSAERLRLGDAWVDEDRVFPSSIGTALDTNNLRKHWLRLIARAGLPEIHYHDLRHSAASWLLSQGVPATEVAELLGHSSAAITQRVYGHVMPGSKDRVAAAMATIFPARKKPTEQAVRDA